MLASSAKRALTAAAFGMAATAAAAATHVTVDFTDAATWNDPSSSVTLFSGQGVAETTVTISGAGGPITFNAPNERAAFGPLVSTSEGLGIGDDEISFPNQSITVSFSGQGVLFKGFHFGKLFADTNDDEAEIAVVTFNTGESFEFAGTIPFQSTTPRLTGYQFFALPTPVRATSVTFSASDQNDGVGAPDYALLGIDVAPVPVPAPFALLAAAMGGLGVLSRRRARRAAA